MKLYRRPGSNIWWCYHRAGGKTHRKTMGTTDEKKAKDSGRAWAQRLNELYAKKREIIMLSNTIGSFLVHCRESSLAKLTVAGYASKLKFFLARNGDEDLWWWDADTAYDKVMEYFDTRTHEVSNLKPDRLVLSAFFNYLKAKRWYKGENPADAKLHGLRRPRRMLKKPKRCMTPEEDLVLRREAQKSRLWPIILLTRWAGMRRGEACLVRWSEIDLDKGFADVVGHEGARKHARRVWLAPWVVLQLRAIKPNWIPEDGTLTLWPYHPDTSTDGFAVFSWKHFGRRVTFNDLRASFTTESFVNGLSAEQESRLVGHSAAVAERYYSEFEAEQARFKLPPDPLTTAPPEEPDEGDAARTGS
jgi:integrase